MLKRKRLVKIAVLGGFLLLGFLPITWFRGDFLINYGDQGFSLLALEDFRRYSFFSWHRLWATGFPLSGSIAGFFYYAFPLLTQLGISLVSSEKILYYFIFTFAGLSMYVLASSLVEKNKQMTGITAALTYLFNFYPLLAFWNAFINLAFFYASAPLLLFLYINLLKTKRKKYFFVWLLTATLIFSPAAANPAAVIVLWLLNFSYLIWHFWSKKEKMLPGMKISFWLFVSWFLLNTWWILPAASNVNEAMIASGAATTAGSQGILEDMSLFTSFLNLFRFFGPWAFYAQYAGDPFFPYHKVYLSPIFIILSFFGPIIVLLSFFHKRKNPEFLYFALLFCTGLFLMKGVHAPFGFINRFIVLKIPFFVVFRNSYEKFGIISLTGYSVLFSFGFVRFYRLLKKFLKRRLFQFGILGILGLLLFVVYPWPFWSGDLIYEGGKIRPGARIKIPSYYYETGNWLRTMKEDFRLLSLPHQDGAAYDWDYGYVGSDEPAIRLFQKPIVTHFDPKDTILRPYFAEVLGAFAQRGEREKQKQLSVLQMTNIKYILLHNDLIYEINTPQPELKAEKIKEILEANGEIKKERSFGKLDFYKISDDYFLPHFYIPKKTISLSGNAKGIVDTASLIDKKQRWAIFTEKDKVKKINEEASEFWVQARDFNFEFLDIFSGQGIFCPFFIKNEVCYWGVSPGQSINVNPSLGEYEMEILKNGDYEFFLSKTQKVPEIEIAGKKLILQDAHNIKNDWLISERIFLKKGKAKIKMKFGDVPNVLEKDNWRISFQQANIWHKISGSFQTDWQAVQLSIDGKGIVLPAYEKGEFEFYVKSFLRDIPAELSLEGENGLKDREILGVKFDNLKAVPVWEPEILGRLAEKTETSNNDKEIPAVTFKRINPAKYRVLIEGVKKPYFLVFNESFHPNWQLFLVDKLNDNGHYGKITGEYFNKEIKEGTHKSMFLERNIFETWTEKSIPEGRHFLTNGYANGWYITPEEAGSRENYELIVEFTPQRLVYFGMIISLTTAVGLMLLGFVMFKKRRLRLRRI